MGDIDKSPAGVHMSVLYGSAAHLARNTTLVKDHPGDVRGQEPTDAEKQAIEKQWGLSHGCILLMGGAKWWYDCVGTWGEEEGEKPCLWAHKVLKNGTTSDVRSLLNVWRVE